MSGAPNVAVTGAACDGCGACVQACAATRPEGDAAIRLIATGDGHVPLLCRHCHDAPCAAACMAGCRRRDAASDRVVTDYERCIGCWMCVMSCPFGAIFPIPAHGARPHGIALKCDGCADQAVAPCVSACGRGALRQVSPLQLARERREQAARALLGAD